MTAIIEARALTKRYGRVEALNGMDLHIEPGAVVALLGPNGAGKTTFVRTVATLVRPDGGTLRVGGFDVTGEARQVRGLIGLAGQHAAVEGAMTGRENLEMVARLYGQSRRTARANTGAVLADLGLDEAAGRLVRTYSGGMRRRLDLGASLVGSPRLLLLDEPTTGLDPRSRIELWDAIRALAGRGTDVLLTTQYLDEADRLADRVVIIDHGRVIADGSPAELKRQAGRDVIEVHVRSAADTAEAARLLGRLGRGEARCDPATRRVSISVDGGSDRLMAAVRALDEEAVPVEDVALRRPTLDEVFLALTGQPLGTGPTPAPPGGAPRAGTPGTGTPPPATGPTNDGPTNDGPISDGSSRDTSGSAVPSRRQPAA
jgi:ABC-2 type transport system ATP-binding protein